MLRSKSWTELTTKGIDGKGKDRAVEVAEVRIRRQLRSKKALSEGGRRGSTAAKRRASLRLAGYPSHLAVRHNWWFTFYSDCLLQRCRTRTPHHPPLCARKAECD